VQGLWHLGSVTAACLASVGHEVVGLDSNVEFIARLTQGRAPLFEPNLDNLISDGISSGCLQFTSDTATACKDAQVLWVAFDTPVDDGDIADIDFVMDQVKSALKFLPINALVVVSSQLPVGSVAKLESYAKEFFSKRQIRFACSPENLRLGKAVNVFLDPDRIVVGVRSDADRIVLERLLHPISKKIEWMSVEAAEMTKHAINAFLATSVAFANEIAAICELVGADAKEVERGLKTEARIGHKAYLSPGGPFAGGTLARDIEFLGKISQEKHIPLPLISSVRQSNDEHKGWLRRKLVESFPDIKNLRVAVWGLTYKAGTDTLRRSLSVEFVDWLIDMGATVQVFDPTVKDLPTYWEGRVKQSANALENINEVQVLVVGTEWPVFKDDAVQLLALSKSNLMIIDPNRYLQESLKGASFEYLSVGSRRSS